MVAASVGIGGSVPSTDASVFIGGGFNYITGLLKVPPPPHGFEKQICVVQKMLLFKVWENQRFSKHTTGLLN